MAKLFPSAILILLLSSVSAAQQGQPAPAPAPAPAQPAQPVDGNASGNPTDPNDPNAQPQAVKEIDTAKQVSDIQNFLKPFVYDREQLRDPFETQSSLAPLKAGQVYGPFLEIQQFRLSDLKLKGLVWNTSNPVAIFEGPNKKDYRLRIKDYVGENFGYVAMIREKEVVVIQTIEEDGRRYSTTKVVFLE